MKALITGGLGFVGSNYAYHLLSQRDEVVVYDNWLRGRGCLHNKEWLESHPSSSKLRVVKGDVRNFAGLSEVAKDASLIVHAAAQVSVPESVKCPDLDFTTNVIGTFNLLEVARRSSMDPTVIFTSSNKVYGTPRGDTADTLGAAGLRELEKKYDFALAGFKGIDETFTKRGEEPYGASKAAADLYMETYAIRYGLKTVTFRCSCMYGPHQWGQEEQGWVAWFCFAFAKGHPITIFGNGKQVRDLLYIEDVMDAFDAALHEIDNTKGLAFNLGGGKANAVSLLEVIAFLEAISGKKVQLKFDKWRPGDNWCYYTDIRKARSSLNWEPETDWKSGVRKTYEWARLQG